MQESVLHAALAFVSVAYGTFLCATCSASIPAAFSSFDDSGVGLAYAVSTNKGTDEQIQYYERCTAESPSNDAYHVELGIAHCIKALDLRDGKAATDQDVTTLIEHHFGLAKKEFQAALTVNPSNAEAYAYQGMVYSEQKQYSNAIECANRAVQIGPMIWIVWYYRGVILERVWQPQNSVDAYTTAIRLNPDTVQPYLSLARLYNTMKRYNDALCLCSNAMARFPACSDVVSAMARSLLKAGHADEVIEICQKWLKDNPNDIQARYRLGQGLAGCHRYDEAIQEEKRVLAANPRLCDAYNEIGLCLWAKGDRDAAIREFRTGLGVHTNCHALSVDLGECLEEANAHEEAIEVLERTWAINPYSFEVCVPLANAYFHKGQHEKAKQVCFRLMALMPWVADPYFELAGIYLNSGDYDRSVQYGREGLVREPASGAGWYNVGLALHRQRKWSEASDALAEAVRLGTNALNPHLVYAEALRLSGKFNKALDACHTAIDRFPTNAEPLVSMGLVWETQLRLTNAAAAYRQAVVLDTNCLDAINGIGRVMATEGRLPEAVDAFRQAMLISPTNSVCRSSLISTLIKIGDRSGARQVLDQGMAMMPTDVVLMTAQAELLADEGNITGAVKVLEHTVQMYTNDSSSRFNLAHYYEALGRQSLAVSNWLLIATNDPSFPVVHQRLALTYARTGHLQEALTEFRQYADLVPADATAHNDVGYTYYQLGKHDEAIREYEAGIACNPGLGIIYYNLALAYYAKGWLRDAAKCCEKAKIAGYPGDPRFTRLLPAVGGQQSESAVGTNWRQTNSP